MSSVNGTVIVIPAFNEEKWVGKSIDLIRATGVKARIIVVNDGSTDGTSKVAMQKGCDVLNFPKNRGKSSACLAGIKEALRGNAVCVITLDADMTKIPSHTLKLLEESASKATVKKEAKIFIAPYEEGTPSKIERYQYSGIRSFSKAACLMLRRKEIKSVPCGMGWEEFLNVYTKIEKVRLNTEPVMQRAAFLKTKGTLQSRDMIETRARMARRGLAKLPPGSVKQRRRRRK